MFISCRILFILFALHFASSVLFAQDTARLVDIGGGRKLYLKCSGKMSSSTVILEAGGGGSTESWNRVQTDIAGFAHVCSYDRAGTGNSPAAGHSETVAEQVDDLHALLQASSKPPFVLVGHSIGGLLVRKYQTRFASEVVGMVLVDSAHEEQLIRFKDIPGAIVGPPANPATWPAQGFLVPGQRMQWHTNVPLVVIEHGHPMDLPPGARAHAQRLEQIMHELQLDLASRSSQGELRKAERSGHDIPREQPDIIVQAVRDVLSKIKPGSLIGKPPRQ